MITRKSSIEAIGGLDQFRRQFVRRSPARPGDGPARLPHPPAEVTRARRSPVQHLRRRRSHIHRWLVIIRHYYPVRARVMSVLDLGLWWGLLYWGLAWLAGEGPRLGAYLVGGLILASGVSAAVVNVNFARDGNLWRFLWVTAVLEVLRLPLILHSELTDNILRGDGLPIRHHSATGPPPRSGTTEGLNERKHSADSRGGYLPQVLFLAGCEGRGWLARGV